MNDNKADQISDEFVERVEEAVGFTWDSWDGIGPRELIRAILNVDREMNETSKPTELPPDLRGPAIVVRGCVLDGFEFIGPFDTADAAGTWCESLPFSEIMGRLHSVVLLKNPNEVKAKS